MLYDFNYMTLWKSPNYGHGKKISSFWGLEVMEG